MMQTSKTSAEA